MKARHASPSIAAGRMRRAGALVAAGAIALGLVCATAESGLANNSLGSDSLVRRLWLSMSAGTPLEDSLKEAGILKLTQENAPEWLERELIGLDAMDQPICNDRCELIWFLRKGSSADAAAFIRDELTSKGWSTCGSDGSGIETFVKGKGECTWAMAECAQAGDDVAIVLHTRHI